MAYSKALKYSHVLIGISNLAKAISHPARLKILFDLQKEPLRIAQLALNHPISKKTVSAHCQILLKNELIFAEVKGNKTYYSYNNMVIPNLIRKALKEIYDNQLQQYMPKPLRNLKH